jgi:hypothetical protein
LLSNAFGVKGYDDSPGGSELGTAAERARECFSAAAATMWEDVCPKKTPDPVPPPIRGFTQQNSIIAANHVVYRRLLATGK